MTFFKTTWFRCVACLLILMLFSGSSITILADLLYVSPDMRTARAIKKIYGEEKAYSTVIDIDDGDDKIEYDGVGSINKIYDVSGDMLFQTTGYHGYKEGTITLWIKAVNGGEKYAIEKVILQSFTKQTLINNLSDKFYEKFTLTDITDMYNSGNYFFADAKADKTLPANNVVSGATGSSTAACNAVNCVIKYFGGER